MSEGRKRQQHQLHQQPLRRALLIAPSMHRYYEGVRVKGAISASPPLNLAVLAGELLAQGVTTRVLDLDRFPQLMGLLPSVLEAFDPDMVGITLRSPLLSEALSLGQRIKRLRPNTLLIAGGVHPSVRPEDVLEGAFDLAVIGEGELPLRYLARGTRREEIPGLAFRLGGGVCRTDPSPRVENLDDLPFPAWSCFEVGAYRQGSLVAPFPPVADLESSRGCPSHCIYCTRAVLGHAFRAKSSDRVVAEVRAALKAGFRSFNLVDDCFTTDLERAVCICERLQKLNLKVPWTLTNGIRVSHSDRSFFRAARRAGLHLVAFGLETGNQALLDRVGKGTSLAMARDAVKAAHAEGLTTLGYFMVGLPGETLETLEETLEFACSLELDYAKFSLTLPLPGTKLYEQWNDLIDPRAFDAMNIHRPGGPYFRHPTLEAPVLEAYLKRAYRRFYLRPGYLLRRLADDVLSGEVLAHIRVGLEVIR